MSVCVSILAAVVQYALRMRRIILPSVGCLAVPYFFHIISYKTRCSVKVVEDKMCDLISYTNFV